MVAETAVEKSIERKSGRKAKKRARELDLGSRVAIYSAYMRGEITKAEALEAYSGLGTRARSKR